MHYRNGYKQKKIPSLVLAILAAAFVISFLLTGCGKSELTANSDQMEVVAGKYKRTVMDTGDSGGIDKAFSGILRLFGDVVLTLKSDGTGLLDFSDLGLLAGDSELITWGEDHTIHISDEDGTWRYEDDTLYIETTTTYQEFERIDD